jgi:hypothetical protein
MVPRVHRGDYGLVQVVEGSYAGRVGYYDGDEGPLAFVHVYGVFMSYYVLIRRSWLRPITGLPLELAQQQAGTKGENQVVKGKGL